MYALALDEQKGKYFKIQKSHLASGSSAAYSSDNVKRRKLEDEAHRAAEQRRRLLKNHIRRHVGLDRNRVAAAVLDREVGAPSAAGGVGPRLMISCVGGDKPEVWAAGLEPKGEVISVQAAISHSHSSLLVTSIHIEAIHVRHSLSGKTRREDNLPFRL